MGDYKIKAGVIIYVERTQISACQLRLCIDRNQRGSNFI